MIKYSVEIHTRKNSKAEDKPNEDLAVFNDELGIGMVLDGVSRDRENGVYPNPSPAQVATQLFVDVALKTAKMESKKGIERIQAMVNKGNCELKKFNNELKHRFPAGTVGIFFSIEDDKFHYGYVGDCYALVIRNGVRRIFTECQTAMVAKHKNCFSSDEIRFNICNHISHPCGYGVLDGNNGAMDFVKYGTINISHEDVILIYTDGMAKSIEDEEVFGLMNKPLNILNDVDLDTVQDDRTCIRIIFENK